MALSTESKAALVFLVLYTVLFCLLKIGYLTRRLKLRSRYSIVTLHVSIRLAAQAAGFAFGIVGYTDIGLLIAYFILGAEGYFTLVLCAFRFLVSWQYHNLEARDSWLEPREPPDTPYLQRIRNSFRMFGQERRPMAFMHYLLVIANCLIVVGGAMLAGSPSGKKGQRLSLQKAKAIRAAGQAIFLAINGVLLLCILWTMRKTRSEGKRVHPTLFLLLAAWPFLFTRGIYGVMSAIYNPFNYFYAGNYVKDGLSDSYVISEYLLATTMEWTSCALLMLTWYTSRNDPPKVPLAKWESQEKEMISSY
ncbi:hypothetical protein H0H92_015994 [Tricholoma furcatifolium]|nr:hypothetical protein H0H92_015994 [Tricholoma furcatifolium]